MQDMGFLRVKEETILVLFRTGKHGRSLKLRPPNNHWMGTSLPEESEYLEEHPEALERLKAGEVIEL